MPDPRQLLDDYATAVVGVETEHLVFEPVQHDVAAPEAISALRAILDLHPIGNPGDAAVAWCGGCGDADTAPDWPCPNVQAITAALAPAAQQSDPPPLPESPPPEPSRCYWSGGIQVHVKPWCRCGRWPWLRMW